MEGKNHKPGKVVGGFAFHTNQDVELADLERKKIAYLEERMDYSNPDSILRIYEKAIHDNIFKTPVGIFYLKGLRDYLLSQDEIPAEAVEPIPLNQTFVKEKKAEHAQRRENTETTKRIPPAFSFSVILNFLLAAVVVAMFAIALNAEQPNILNYEKAITNRYASWEQELSEREQAVREKERELNIEVE